MSDGPIQTGGTPRIIAQAQAKGEQVVKLVSLPQALQNNARGQRLEGEVVRANNDGSVRIRTPQGDVDVEVRGRQPQPGQRLEVDVPAGRPPRQAVIRQSSAPPQAPQDIEQQPVQTQIARAQSRAEIAAQNARSDQVREVVENIRANPQARPTQSPSQNQPANTAPRPPAQSTQPLPQQTAPDTARPLPLGTPVRLTPVTPAQFQQYITQLTQTFPPAVSNLQITAFRAAQIVQNVTTQNIQNLINTSMPQPAQQTQSALSPVQNILSAILKPAAPAPALSPAQILIQNDIFQTLAQTAPQNLTPAGPSKLQASTPAIQILPASAVNTQISAPLNLLSNFNPAPSLPPLGLQQGALPITTPLSAPQTLFTQGGAPPFVNPVDVKVQNIIQNGQNILISPPAAEELGTRQPNNRLPLPAQIALPKAINTPTAQAGQIVGQVTGFTPQSLPIVSFQLPGTSVPQSFILQYQPAGVTIGSQIIIQPNALAASVSGQIAPQPGQPGLTPTLLQIPPTLLSFGNQYPPLLMQETYQALAQAAPALAASLASSLPSPANPVQLGAAALLFLTAVRAGDLGSWLGDKKIDALTRAGKSDLLSRLTGSGNNSAPRASADINLPSGEWRAVPMPMFWDGDIRQVNLFVRRDDENPGSGDESEKQQTRFIFDLTLSRMGDVQVDGLMREDRLDMVIRTQNPLSAPMQQMLKQVYTKALDSESLRGELGFQGDPRQWVNILKAEQALGMNA